MADEVLADEETPTEVDVLTDISNDLRYLIKCIIPNSVYQDFEFPEDDSDD